MAGVNKYGLEVQDLSGNILLSTTRPPSIDVDFGPWLELLENASFIQGKIGTKIKAPLTPTSWDLELSRKIVRLLTEKKIELPEDYSFGFVFSKGKTGLAIDELRQKGFIENIEIQAREFKTKLLESELTLGPARILVPRARPRETVEEIVGRYQTLGDMQDMLVQLLAFGDKRPVAYLLK
jgi:hypothetical protein